MLRPISRGLSRRGLTGHQVSQVSRQSLAGSRRALSTVPPAARSRSWKSSAARWAVAIGGVYYYNTGKVFAEEPEASLIPKQGGTAHDDSKEVTLESVVADRRKRLAAEQRERDEPTPLAANETSLAEGAENTAKAQAGAASSGAVSEEMEEEAEGEGAFNPETGEINWDCPCLGGMAHGPCGPEFREAFSCFVFSKEEPKGMDCIDRFKGMQDCFRKHPDIYGEEIDDEEADAEAAVAGAGDADASAPATTAGASLSTQSTPYKSASESSTQPSTGINNKSRESGVISRSKDQDEGASLVTKSDHDTTPSN